MLRKAAFAAALAVALMFVCLPAGAQTLIFGDDLENGPGNWTVYPGSPNCTPMQYVGAATDPNCNHTAGGSHGFEMTQASDRVYRDLDLSAYSNATVRFSLWFYDVLDYRPSAFESFDIRNAGMTQVLGIGATYSGTNYICRVLKAADGTAGPNWVWTSTARTVGWHHFEIDQYRGAGAGRVDFLIDDSLVYQNTNAYDLTLNRVVLGMGWAGSVYQSGYLDDITVSTVPEPSCLVALVLGIGCLPIVAKRRRRA